MRRAGPLLTAAFALAARGAAGQFAPHGPEFRVNTYTTSSQIHPVVASDAAADFVVVWDSVGQDGDNYGVFGQTFTGSGTPTGPEFRANTYTTGLQFHPSVASDASGNFVVVWQNVFQFGGPNDVFGQRYSGAGVPMGSEFRVNSYTTDTQGRPSVAADSAGNFVVVWEGRSDGSNSDYGIFGQRFAASGAPLGPEFRVNSYTGNAQRYPSVAVNASGAIIVVWQSVFQDGSYEGVFAQRFAASGAPLAGEFRVNTSVLLNQEDPSVAVDGFGNFVVTWTSDAPGNPGVFAQRFASSGVPLGPEFRVNTYTGGPSQLPAVATNAFGDFVIVWTTSYGFPDSDVIAQRYEASGAPFGPPFRVNTYTPNGEFLPAVTSSPSGDFVVIWQSFNQDGGFQGIYGQRYAPLVPVELIGIQVE